ncbi:hypothetical protein BESB_068130 [Besnoitia besnoiti]|uniref:riboflavin kinase n=1 Tax=Besnoitia besnoiti TaxID=94643 RepID=A0A2A9MH84_BESBE|nr:hypothetical protein BESB_068130 [Besnoitia besnoiti]PFH34780.1 hypothetical protein BESB_068130 [Besnoitia besnoiti]
MAQFPHADSAGRAEDYHRCAPSVAAQSKVPPSLILLIEADALVLDWGSLLQCILQGFLERKLIPDENSRILVPGRSLVDAGERILAKHKGSRTSENGGAPASPEGEASVDALCGRVLTSYSPAYELKGGACPRGRAQRSSWLSSPCLPLTNPQPSAVSAPSQKDAFVRLLNALKAAVKPHIGACRFLRILELHALAEGSRSAGEGDGKAETAAGGHVDRNGAVAADRHADAEAVPLHLVLCTSNQSLWQDHLARLQSLPRGESDGLESPLHPDSEGLLLRLLNAGVASFFSLQSGAAALKRAVEDLQRDGGAVGSRAARADGARSNLSSASPQTEGTRRQAPQKPPEAEGGGAGGPESDARVAVAAQTIHFARFAAAAGFTYAASSLGAPLRCEERVNPSKTPNAAPDSTTEATLKAPSPASPADPPSPVAGSGKTLSCSKNADAVCSLCGGEAAACTPESDFTDAPCWLCASCDHALEARLLKSIDDVDLFRLLHAQRAAVSAGSAPSPACVRGPAPDSGVEGGMSPPSRERPSFLQPPAYPYKVSPLGFASPQPVEPRSCEALASRTEAGAASVSDRATQSCLHVAASCAACRFLLMEERALFWRQKPASNGVAGREDVNAAVGSNPAPGDAWHAAATGIEAWGRSIVLASPILVTGTVVKGFGRGSKMLGIPTANVREAAQPVCVAPDPLESELCEVGCNGASPLRCDSQHSRPVTLVPGVYYGWAALLPVRDGAGLGPDRTKDVNEGSRDQTDGAAAPPVKVYKTAMSIGYNPYFDNTSVTIEPYIYHEFDDDFVGSPITVIITGFLRSEAAFSSFGHLIQAIQNDCEICRNALNHPVHLPSKRLLERVCEGAS